MSRSERRAYQRMTKHQDPYAVPVNPAARARLDRQRAKRAAGPVSSDPTRLLPPRGVWWVFGGALGVFLIGLSVAWPQGGVTALLVGVGAGIAWIAAALAFAVWRRRSRMSAAGQRGRPAAR
jgi:hypothetical protein